MDAVASAGAVGRRIVGTKDRDYLPLRRRDLKDQRNQVGLGLMMFAVAAPRVGGVEIAENGVSNAVDLVIPTKNSLDLKL